MLEAGNEAAGLPEGVNMRKEMTTVEHFSEHHGVERKYQAIKIMPGTMKEQLPHNSILSSQLIAEFSENCDSSSSSCFRLALQHW